MVLLKGGNIKVNTDKKQMVDEIISVIEILPLHKAHFMMEVINEIGTAGALKGELIEEIITLDNTKMIEFIYLFVLSMKKEAGIA